MAECRPFPGAVDDVLMKQVGTLLGQALGLYVPGVSTFAPNDTLLQSIAQDNSALVSIYCGAAWPGNCMGLCPNSDLAGPGVRAAFYAQSFLNAFLIAISPEDALSACWSAVLLTAAVILPAIIQKQSKQLTLHHAMLVLNFSTMSTIAALASAPFCEVWREDAPPVAANPDNGELPTRGSQDNRSGGEDPPRGGNSSPRGTVPRVLDSSAAERHDVTPALTPTLLGAELHADSSAISHRSVETASFNGTLVDQGQLHVSFPAYVAASSDTVGKNSLESDGGDAFRKVKWDSPTYRTRVFLSLAIIIQVSLQWTWAVFLFTSPEYAQEPCNAGTKVVLFGAPFDVTWLNDRPAHYAVFPGWLLTCMAITLSYGIALVYHNQVKFPLVPSGHSNEHESAYYIVRLTSNTCSWLKRAWKVERSAARRIMAANVVAFMLWAAFVAVSEIQRASNCVFEENSDWSFGQVSSMLLAAVPLWPIAVAISRERARSEQKRKRARRLRVQLPTVSAPPMPGTPTTSPPTYLPGSPPPSARSRANSMTSRSSPLGSPPPLPMPQSELQLTPGAAADWPSGERLGNMSVVVTPPQDDQFIERPFRGRLSPI